METKVADTFLEYGVLPTEAEEKAPKMYQLMLDIQDGLTTEEIIRDNPSFGFRDREIDALRARLMSEKYRTEERDVRVYYLYGDTGTGKTRSIMDKHPAHEVCRITNYGGRNGIRFDAYQTQPVLVFEEFHSQIPIGDMLNYLDRYPLNLPARYADKVACYTTVYITSNAPLEQQYPDVQLHEPETWEAFLRRIHMVKEYRKGRPAKEVKFENL